MPARAVSTPAAGTNSITVAIRPCRGGAIPVTTSSTPATCTTRATLRLNSGARSQRFNSMTPSSVRPLWNKLKTACALPARPELTETIDQ
ncbi:hypothetical protein Aab01nite_39090 [Paractinoplanes abujensis]|nr:hypothetical protein Aab01nite_39090 [Actinoplanes abujensis]